MHPIKPQLAQTDTSTLMASDGKRLFIEFAAMAKQQGAGYVG